MTPEKKAERGRALAVWIRETILQLGPTFIKLGAFGCSCFCLLARILTVDAEAS